MDEQARTPGGKGNDSEGGSDFEQMESESSEDDDDDELFEERRPDSRRWVRNFPISLICSTIKHSVLASA